MGGCTLQLQYGTDPRGRAWVVCQRLPRWPVLGARKSQAVAIESSIARFVCMARLKKRERECLRIYMVVSLLSVVWEVGRLGGQGGPAAMKGGGRQDS